MSEIQLFPIREQHIPESLTHKGRALCSPMRAFEPHPLLRNHHVAIVAAAFWPRKLSRLPAATDRLFEVEPGTRLLAKCHWQQHLISAWLLRFVSCVCCLSGRFSLIQSTPGSAQRALTRFRQTGPRCASAGIVSTRSVQYSPWQHSVP